MFLAHHALYRKEVEEVESYKMTFNKDSWLSNPSPIFQGSKSVHLRFKLSAKVDSNTGNAALAVQYTGSSSTTNRGLVFDILPSGRIRLSIDANAVLIYSDSGREFEANEWYDIHFTSGSNSGTVMYVNGVKQTQTSSRSLGVTYAGNLGIGGLSGTFGPQNWLAGSLSTVTAWDYELSHAQVIDSIYNRPTAGETGLMESFLFTEGIGSTVTGVNSDVLSMEGPAVWETTPSIGKYDLVFQSIYNDSVSIDGNVLSGARTISFWYTPNTANNFGILGRLGMGADDWSQGGFSVFQLSQKLSFALGTSSGLTESVTSDSVVAGRTHVTCVIDQTEGLILYINGVRQSQSGAATYTSALIASTKELGVNGHPSVPTGTFGDMVFSDLKVFSVTRTPAEVINDMTEIPKGDETGLIAFFPQIQGEGEHVPEYRGKFRGTINSTNATGSVYKDTMWQKQ